MLYTNKQVSAGHPDIICDRITDAILTDHLQYDKYDHAVVVTLNKEQHVYIAGEISFAYHPDVQASVKWVLMRCEPSISGNSSLITDITKQSEDIFPV